MGNPSYYYHYWDHVPCLPDDVVITPLKAKQDTDSRFKLLAKKLGINLANLSVGEPEETRPDYSGENFGCYVGPKFTVIQATRRSLVLLLKEAKNEYL